jgi:hypothetical protein
VIADTELLANSMYREGSNFAIESPSPPRSPSSTDVSVPNLRTQGAFVLDASRIARRDSRPSLCPRDVPAVGTGPPWGLPG